MIITYFQAICWAGVKLWFDVYEATFILPGTAVVLILFQVLSALKIYFKYYCLPSYNRLINSI